MVALIFPGQGSQFVGMGKDLADAYPIARETFEEADDVLGASLSRIMWEGPETELTLTHNAQPAILVHSIAVYRVLHERIPDIRFAAGHSLGEFSAYVAAAAMSFPNAVTTVRRRGQLMFRAGEQRPGAMAAILGMDDADLERVCADASAEGGVVVPANYNAQGQLVISGDVPGVQRAMELAKENGAKKAVQLNVSGAFHSPLMSPAAQGLTEQLNSVQMVAPRFPVVSNVTAHPVRDPAEARRLLIEQLTSPVRWTSCVRTIVAHGVTDFVELGPGSVLTGLMKRIDKSAKSRAVGTADEVNQWQA